MLEGVLEGKPRKNALQHAFGPAVPNEGQIAPLGGAWSDPVGKDAEAGPDVEQAFPAGNGQPLMRLAQVPRKVGLWKILQIAQVDLDEGSVHRHRTTKAIGKRLCRLAGAEGWQEWRGSAACQAGQQARACARPVGFSGASLRPT